MIVITHEPDVAERAGRVIRLRDGSVIEDARRHCDRWRDRNRTACCEPFQCAHRAAWHLREQAALRAHHPRHRDRRRLGDRARRRRQWLRCREPRESRAARIEHAHGPSRRVRIRCPRRHAKPQRQDHRQRHQGARQQEQRARRRARSSQPSTSKARPSCTTAPPTPRARCRARPPTSAPCATTPCNTALGSPNSSTTPTRTSSCSDSTDVKNLLGQQAEGSALVGQQVLIGGKSFTVIGVFKSKGSNGFQDQDSIAIMPLTTARDDFVGNTGTVDGLTAQAVELQQSRGRAKRNLRGARRTTSRLELHRLQRAEPTIVAADRLEQQPNLHRAARRRRRDLAARRRDRRHEHHARDRHRTHP